MDLPKLGTPEYEAFMNKARNPNSVEAKVVQQMMNQAALDAQKQFRTMLDQMIDLVPGQLFRDVVRFHDKFQLSPTENPTHELPNDMVRFRAKFLLEELCEYMRAVGLHLAHDPEEGRIYVANNSMEFDAENAFDGLIDLVYVALGTAFLHRFPFNDGWNRVQEANMAKVRASGADDSRSTRKHSADIVKPTGWLPPVLSDLL